VPNLESRASLGWVAEAPAPTVLKRHGDVRSSQTTATFRDYHSPMTFYRRNLPHLQRDNKPHFVTFVTKNRWIMPAWARDLLLGCCIHDHRIRYDLHVAVVMPDHGHVILIPTINDERHSVVALAEIMKAIKGTSSHQINHKFGRQGSIWQEESFDRVLRSSEKLDEKIVYILQNPVRHGLVREWCEYSWVWYRERENPYSPPQAT
jgi:REP element-mobilizing transposase RayT